MKRVLMAFVLLAGLVLALPARAQSFGIDFATQSGGYTRSFSYAAGDISRTQYFLLSWPLQFHNVSISFTHLSSSPGERIEGFSAYLMDAFTGRTKTFDYNEFGPLQALTVSDVWNSYGYYMIRLEGIALTAGSFTVSAIASPVPEPETAALFAAGLLLLGARLRSGTKKSAPAGHRAQLA